MVLTQFPPVRGVASAAAFVHLVLMLPTARLLLPVLALPTRPVLSASQDSTALLDLLILVLNVTLLPTVWFLLVPLPITKCVLCVIRTFLSWEESAYLLPVLWENITTLDFKIVLPVVLAVKVTSSLLYVTELLPLILTLVVCVLLVLLANSSM
jgi:hypothetical protein